MSQEPLFHLIYNHMLTFKDWDQCGSGSMLASPTSLVTQQDCSPDEQLNNNNLDGEPSQAGMSSRRS